MADENVKIFSVKDAEGNETLTPASSKQEILADLQRMGALEEGTTVELYEPNKKKEVTTSDTFKQCSILETIASEVEDIIFTMPGTDTKVLNRNGELFGLEWTEISTKDLIKRLGVEDINYGEDPQLANVKLLDWVPLKQEEENAS